MSHPEFLRLGLSSKFLPKKWSESIFRPLFDATMLDMTWLKT